MASDLLSSPFSSPLSFPLSSSCDAAAQSSQPDCSLHLHSALHTSLPSAPHQGGKRSLRDSVSTLLFSPADRACDAEPPAPLSDQLSLFEAAVAHIQSALQDSERLQKALPLSLPPSMPSSTPPSLPLSLPPSLLLLDGGHSAVCELEQRYAQLAALIEECAASISSFMQACIVEAYPLWQLSKLCVDLHAAKTQLQLDQCELQFFKSPTAPFPCLAALVIYEDPFNQTIKQHAIKKKVSNKVPEKQAVVKFLSSPHLAVQALGPVVGAIVHFTPSSQPSPPRLSAPPADAAAREAQTQSLRTKKRARLEGDADSCDAAGVGLLNATSALHPDTKKAVFSELRFPSGTGGRPAWLQFSVQVEYTDLASGASAVATVQSALSQPFIVICNESRWMASTGKLLKIECFPSTDWDDIFGPSAAAAAPSARKARAPKSAAEPKSKAAGRRRGNAPPSGAPPEAAPLQLQPCDDAIAWPLFCNVLQRHYLNATRQNSVFPDRAITREEFDFLHELLAPGKHALTSADFDRFWEWFGPVLHPIRHCKALGALYMKGFVYGLVSKARSEELLQAHGANAFLIRFSERRAGKLAIAHLREDALSRQRVVKHYLVDPYNSSAEPTRRDPYVLDFLRANHSLEWIVQKEMAGDVKKSKNVVLNEALPKRTKARAGPALLDGYSDPDELLANRMGDGMRLSSSPPNSDDHLVALGDRSALDAFFMDSSGEHDAESLLSIPATFSALEPPTPSNAPLAPPMLNGAPSPLPAALLPPLPCPSQDAVEDPVAGDQLLKEAMGIFLVSLPESAKRGQTFEQLKSFLTRLQESPLSSSSGTDAEGVDSAPVCIDD